MTFSVVFHDSDSETWGVGVASKFIAVGSVVPWAKAGTGAVATQSFTNYSYGPEGLKLLKDKDASTVLEILTSADPIRETRQAAVVDKDGNVAAFTGKQCMNYAGHITGDSFSVQGNILVGEEVLEAMAREMERGGPILERVIRTLESGDAKGGDRRGRQSAAILIATAKTPFEEFSDRYVDLRIDDSLEPLKEIRRISLLWEATFLEQDMVEIEQYREQVDAALRGSGYGTLMEWARNNNFDDKVTEDKIGEKVLEALIKNARDKW